MFGTLWKYLNKIRRNADYLKMCRRRRQLLHDFTEGSGHYKLEDEALDRTLRRTGYAMRYGLVVRKTRELTAKCAVRSAQ